MEEPLKLEARDFIPIAGAIIYYKKWSKSIIKKNKKGAPTLEGWKIPGGLKAGEILEYKKQMNIVIIYHSLIILLLIIFLLKVF